MSLQGLGTCLLLSWTSGFSWPQEDPVAGTPQLSAKLPSCLWQALLLAKA